MIGISDLAAELTLVDPRSWPEQDFNDNIDDFCQKMR
jgi:hypothetical protein